MADPLKYDPIPEPDASIDGLLRTVKALKGTVDQLSGQNPNQAVQAPIRNFVQRENPTAYSVGDFWTKLAVLPGESPVISVWNGRQWAIVN